MISRRLVNRLLELDKPIVCAINGDCIGLAATIALLCDITVISPDARIGDSHVNKVGLVAGDGGTVVWPLLIGVAKAKEYLMRGTLLKGREAERIGLVNHCVPAGEVLAVRAPDRARARARPDLGDPLDQAVDQPDRQGARQPPDGSVDGARAGDLRDRRPQARRPPPSRSVASRCSRDERGRAVAGRRPAAGPRRPQGRRLHDRHVGADVHPHARRRRRRGGEGRAARRRRRPPARRRSAAASAPTTRR